jgi:hypothetical protein
MKSSAGIIADQTKRATKHYLSVCAVFKNEAPHLSEWVEFHRAVGVDHFYLYNNNSEDNFLAVLASRIYDGTVTLVDFPQHPGQLEAYDYCLATYGDVTRWIAFLDIDEYLFSVTADSLRDVLVDYEQYPGVCVNWQVYGSSGRIFPSNKLTIESFTWKAPTLWWRNRQLKSVVDPKRVTRAWDPHRFILSGPGQIVTEQQKPIHTSSSTIVSVDRLRINHYAVKSFSEFLLKRTRGRATNKQLRSLFHFARFDRNDVEDSCAAALADQIRAYVTRAKVPRFNSLMLIGAYVLIRMFGVVLHIKDRLMSWQGASFFTSKGRPLRPKVE